MKKESKNMIQENDIKTFVVEKLLFFIMIATTVIVVTSPWWLRFSCFSNIVESFLKSLKTEGYKSSYIEMIGALLGTFLAITGALWTQHREEKRKENQLIRETATIIYYDFKFAFEQVFIFIEHFENILNQIENDNDYIEAFNKWAHRVKILIDSNWIVNVAKLCNVLDDSEIKMIYQIYGDFETIKSVFEMDKNSLTKRIGIDTCNTIKSNLCNLNGSPIKITEKEENVCIMEKLGKLKRGK